MALTTYNTTAHFEVMYDPAAYPNSIKRAQVLYEMVEAEFDFLTAWFGIKDGFGPDNKIQVKAASKPNYGGQEGGYVAAPVPQGVDGMWINLDAQENVADDMEAGERIKALFVAEFSEILMAYLAHRDGQLTWDRRGSNGEGLSHFCSVLRYPKGYYSYQSKPSVNAWLQAPNRENIDYVATTERTDVNPVSYGCALLFLFYLRSQLNISESKIIQSGGTTLQKTYQNLLGTTDAFAPFIQLLNPYFPPGNTIAVLTENPFPLNHLSFTVDLTSSGLEGDGCQHRYTTVGSKLTVTALINNLVSIYPAQVTKFQWDPPAQGHIVGASDGKSVTLAFDSPGVATITVHVTMTDVAETVTEQKSIQVNVLTLLEAELWTKLCKYWQDTRFIPQPVPIGDPAVYVFPDRQLRELGAVLGAQINEVQVLHALTGRVIQQRTGNV